MKKVLLAVALIASSVAVLAQSGESISNATITTSTVDSTPIGASAPSTGAFTTLTTTSPIAATNLPMGSTSTGTLANRVQPAVWSMPTDPAFGAKCDGSTDDTTALQAWLNAATTNSNLRIPNSSCNFSAPLTVPNVSFLTIEGAGKSSKLQYVGTNTTNTLITIGTFNDSSASYCSMTGTNLRNFRLISDTVMTAGDGLLIADQCEARITDVETGGDLDGNLNLYNAIHLAGGNGVYIKGYEFAGSNASELVNGDNTSQPYVDLFQIQGKIAKAKVGLYLAGNVGNINIDQTDLLGNGTELKIDQTQIAAPNGYVFLGPSTMLDVTGTTSGWAGYDIDIEDPGSTPEGSKVFVNGAWIASAQVVSGSANSGTCVNVGPLATNWSVIFNGGAVTNCALDGIQINNSSAQVFVAGTQIMGNNRYGINATVATNNVSISNVNWPTSTNLNGQNIPNNNISGYTVYGKWSFLPGTGWLSGNTTYLGLGGLNQIEAYNDGLGGFLQTNGVTSNRMGVNGTAVISATPSAVSISEPTTISGQFNLNYSSPDINLNDSSGSNYSTVSLLNAGNTEWQLQNASSSNQWKLGRWVSNAYVDAPIAVSNSNGMVTLADGLTVGNTQILPNLSGTSGSIGGSALATGACTSGTVPISGVTTSMAVQATPTTYPGDGFWWEGYVSATGTVAIKVCASVAGTPTASNYNVRAIQ